MEQWQCILFTGQGTCEVFILNIGVDVSLVAEELNSSSEEQEYNKTHINCFITSSVTDKT